MQAESLLVFIYKVVILCLQYRENVSVCEAIYTFLINHRRGVFKQNLQNDSEISRFLVFGHLDKTLTNKFVLVVDAFGKFTNLAKNF